MASLRPARRAPTTTRALSLSEVPGDFAVVQLPPDAGMPSWALASGSFSALVRTPGELSIVVPQVHVPEGLKAARGWACLRIEGPFDFAETGILAAVAAPLAAAGVGIFALSTYDTDYLLVRREQLDTAGRALAAAGHAVRLRGDAPCG